MLDTYFMVKINIKQKTLNKPAFNISFGPYTHISEATRILVDFAPMYAEKIVNTGNYRYSAVISECILNDKNEWEDIYIPIKENECYKKKLLT